MSKGFDFVYNLCQTTPKSLGARQSGRPQTLRRPGRRKVLRDITEYTLCLILGVPAQKIFKRVV